VNERVGRMRGKEWRKGSEERRRRLKERRKGLEERKERIRSKILTCLLN
jgi:hypothetical protein